MQPVVKFSPHTSDDVMYCSVECRNEAARKRQHEYYLAGQALKYASTSDNEPNTETKEKTE